MTLKEAIERWERENSTLLYEIRGYKSSEYKIGFADGLEQALESLKSYLSECTE